MAPVNSSSTIDQASSYAFSLFEEELKRYKKNDLILEYEDSLQMRDEFLHTVLSAMFNYQIDDDMFNKIIEHTLEEAIMNIYFTGEFDATIVKKFYC